MNKFEYKNLTPFKWFVLENFPFIEADFDALTSYQLWCKVVEYLNKTIDDMNLIGNQMENVTNAFIELQNYVNNYLENLDVQTEVNIKLDEMASNGTLYNIIRPYLIEIVNEQTDFSQLIKVPINKIEYEKNDLLSIATIYENKELRGYNLSTLEPNLRDNNNFICIDIPLINSEIIFPFIYENIPNNVVLIYNSNNQIQPLNFSYSSIQNSQLFNYNEDVQTMSLNYSMSQLENRTNILICFDKNHYGAWTNKFDASQIDFIAEQLIQNKNIRDNTITEEKLTDDLKNKIGNVDLSKLNLEEINLINSETFKDSTKLTGFNTTTKLPTFQNNNDFVCVDTDTIDGKISFLLDFPEEQASYNAVVLYKSNGTGAINIGYNNIINNATSRITFDSITKIATIDCKNQYNSEFDRIVVCMNRNNYKCYISALNCDNINLIYKKLISKDNLKEDFANSIASYENAKILLPSKLKILVNKEIDLHFNNVVRYYNTDRAQNIRMINLGNFGNIYNDKFAKFKTSAMLNNTNVTLQIATSDTSIQTLRKQIEVETINENAGSGQTKKIMFLGDSLTDANVYVTEVKNMFESDNMNIELIGTMDNNMNEGRSGWRAYTYCNCQYGYDDIFANGQHLNSNLLNPFFHNNTFDFSYYMTNNGFTSIDYVFICLGTNDVIRGNYDSVEQLLSYYNTMINSIKQYNSNIKICIWLPPMRALIGIKSKVEFDSAMKMTELFLNNYENRENENIYLVPVYININSELDYRYEEQIVNPRNPNNYMKVCLDRTHPADSGYYKIADVIFTYIKYLATLN